MPRNGSSTRSPCNCIGACKLLVSLPIDKLSRLKVEKLTRDIGKGETSEVEKTVREGD